MSSTATIKAVTDGDTPSSSVLDNLPAFTGVVWARQKQVYHVAMLADDLLDEAHALLRSLCKQAQTRAYPGLTEAQTVPLPMAEISVVLNDALECIDMATEHLSALNVQVRYQVKDEES